MQGKLIVEISYTIPDCPINFTDTVNIAVEDGTIPAFIEKIKSGIQSVLEGKNIAYTFGDGVDTPLIWYPAEILKRAKITIRQKPPNSY